MQRTRTMSSAEARRVVLAAQGFGRARPAGAVTARALRSTVERLNVLQLDAINVLQRTQFVVPFSRLGAYDVGHLHAMTGPDAALYETWAHAASLVPMGQEPLLRWRQEAGGLYDESPTHAARTQAFRAEHVAYLAAVLDEVSERGPLAASQLTDPRRGTGDWWERRGLGRRALEHLFARGELAAWRTPTFERVYDLPERVIPARVRALSTPTREEAHRALLVLAARSYGVATVSDLAGFHMLKPRTAKARVDELVEDGVLVDVAVEGWSEPGFVPAGVTVPRSSRPHATLVSPFDSLVWDRARVKRVFGFDYRIEVYVPAPKRRYGYYVLPVLVGDELVARVDLKADRAASTLRVQSAFAEPETVDAEVADALACELDAMRAWLNLERVAVEQRGDLARPLAGAVASRG